MVKAITDSDFDAEVLNSNMPVLVDFHAKWCAPCKKLAPIMTKLAADYAGKIKVCKLDIDVGKISKNKYGVRTVPTVMLFKNGRRVASVVGLSTYENLVSALGL